jgi:hypothetical protein
MNSVAICSVRNKILVKRYTCGRAKCPATDTIPWIYFVFELTALNIMLLYMILKQESISRYFYKKLNDVLENQ